MPFVEIGAGSSSQYAVMHGRCTKRRYVHPKDARGI